jgi:hypoxanthine phosphoribosyltransferase
MFYEDLYQIEQQIKKSELKFDEILAIARGGVIPGVILSYRLNLPVTFVDWSFRDTPKQDWDKIDAIGYRIRAGSKVLIVDDILDSGVTLANLYDTLRLSYGSRAGYTQCCLAVLVRNTTCPVQIIPEYYGRDINRHIDKDWVEFWWENK